MSKVAVISFSGKVGKTTIAAHLLSPRMNDAPIFAIETQNETASSLGMEVEKLSGEKYLALYKKLLTMDDAIIDVGASNIEDFLDKMIKIDESHVEFDYFVVPVTSDPSIQRECIKTIQVLADIGIPADKIRVVFNRVSADAEEEFPAIIGFAKKSKTCIANPECAIYEAEVFALLASKKLSIGAVLADETDYRALIKAKAGTEKEQAHNVDMHALKGYCKAANRNLDAAFAALFS